MRSSSSPSCFPQRRTADKAIRRQKIDSAKCGAVKLPQIAFDYVPCFAVEAQGFTGALVQFDQAHVIESGAFESECLPPRSCAQLKGDRPVHPPHLSCNVSEDILAGTAAKCEVPRVRPAAIERPFVGRAPVC